MMIPRLANRSPRSRAVRTNMGQPKLESLAAEFALLAQRRSRAVHQLETLDQQRAAAAFTFAKLERRIAWLVRHMDELAPELRDPAVLAEPEPEPPAPRAKPLTRAGKPSMPAHAVNALAEIGRQWVAAQPAPRSPTPRPTGSRRT
jgi:hypothetical protein